MDQDTFDTLPEPRETLRCAGCGKEGCLMIEAENCPDLVFCLACLSPDADDPLRAWHDTSSGSE
jgi:hypothetical protein